MTSRSVVALAILLIRAAAAHADVLDDVRQRGELVWGGDQEGGGPYVYPDPKEPSRVIGCDVDLAQLLAAELGVKARFFQGDWNTLPEFLRNGTIDIILNGYEWTPQRDAQMEASRPYYIYELQLLTREGDGRIRSFDDLRHPPAGTSYSLSVLGGCGAATVAHRECDPSVHIFEYDGNTNAMAQVQTRVHDATLQDLPITIFYRDLPQGRGLKFTGEPVAPGYFVLFAKKGEKRLVAALNGVIEKTLADGRVKSLYDRYGMWTPAQQRLPTAVVAATGDAAPSGWSAVSWYGPILAKAAGMTILLSVLSMPIAIIVGLFVALGRLYGPAILRTALAAYVEVLRGTPVILQLYVIYFLLPRMVHVTMNPIVAAIVGLSINYSAYEAEIYRAGLQAVPRGQMEAALALGMTRATALRRIIVPQAVRIVIPPVTNDFIALFKDTSICSVIAVTELTKQYNILANSTGAVLELAAMTALLYLLMSYPLSLVVRRTERKLAGAGLPVGT